KSVPRSRNLRNWCGLYTPAQKMYGKRFFAHMASNSGPIHWCFTAIRHPPMGVVGGLLLTDRFTVRQMRGYPSISVLMTNCMNVLERRATLPWLTYWHTRWGIIFRS